MATVPNPVDPLSIPRPPSVIALPRTAGPRRTRWLKWAIVASVVVLLIVAAYRWRIYTQSAITYETVPVERGTIQASVTATGTLNAVVDVLVGSQVSGNIKALYADWNTKVTKGQLVALIDPAIFQAQVDQARATLSAAHSAVVTAAAQVEKAKSDSAAAVANEKGTEANAAKDLATSLNAKSQWQRADSLFNDGLISRQDYDSAKATYDSVQAQVTADQAQIDAAKQAIQSAEAGVRVAQSQLASGQAQERQAQAVLDQAMINLAHTKITAPVDGTVIARRMDVGQTVAASFQAPTIFEIAQDLTKMQVDTNVDESDIGNITLGLTATFTVDAYPGTTFHGQVRDIRRAPISAQNVVTYDVVIAASNPDFKLFPGMTANVSILTAKVDDTLKVPNSAVRFRPSAQVLAQESLQSAQVGKQQLYVLAAGKLRSVPAKFGLSDGKFTAIKASDLKPGDLVVVRAAAGTRSSSSSAPGSRSPSPRF
ncbi:MAG: efflux RND transporter periplasmic adaptor subunit [Candidatus Acidiferrum sp.]